MKRILLIFLMFCASLSARFGDEFDYSEYYTPDEVDALLDLINYAFVTGNDVLTDILATELETLSDGSDAQSLHIHDSAYYTETESDTLFLKLDASNDPMQGNLDMGGFNVDNAGTVTAIDVITTPTLINNQVNGDFSQAEPGEGGWTFDGDWVQANDQMEMSGDGVGGVTTGDLTTTFVPTIGKVYKITYDFDTSGSGENTIKVFLDSILKVTHTNISSGTNSILWRATTTTKPFFTGFTFEAPASVVVTIDNVLIEEVEDGGHKFTGTFANTTYEEGKICGDFLSLEVDNLFYGGVLGFDLIPAPDSTYSLGVAPTGVPVPAWLSVNADTVYTSRIQRQVVSPSDRIDFNPSDIEIIKNTFSAVKVENSNTVFNEDMVNRDVTIHGDTVSELLKVDAGLEEVQLKDTVIVGDVEVTGTDGIDYNPGSDQDVDLITVGVTGTPKFWWDEATDSWETNKSLTLPGASLKIGGYTFKEDTTDNDGLELDGTLHIHDVGGVAGNICLHSGTEPTESLDANGYRLWADASGNFQFQKPSGGGSKQVIVDDGAGNVGIGTNDPDRPLEIRKVSPVIRLRATGSTATQTAAYVEFGGTTTGSWDRTGYVGDGGSGDTHIRLRAEDSDLYLGDSTSETVLILSGGDATFSGTINIGDSGKINFRDTDISIGSTLTDGILDLTADFAIDMFYDNADVGNEVDGQSFNINRRAAEGDDYISLYVSKDKKGLIGFSGDDLIQLSTNTVGVNGTTKLGDGGATNYAQFAADGELTLVGTARVLRSVDFEPEAVKQGGVGPGTSTEDGFPVHDFQATNDESVFMHWEIPHDYASGQEIHMHAEYFVDTAPVGAANVTWGVEYKKLSIGDNFDFGAGTTTVIVNDALTTGTPANDKQIHSSPEIQLITTGFEPMDVILIRFFRDADASEDGATDNFGSDARLFNYHLMFLSDKIGQAS